MGLDMYLNKRTYVGNQYKDAKQQVKITIPKNQNGVLFAVDKIKQERISEITEQVGYWRKANAIHRWFVENVQDGNDDCKDYYVESEQLLELLELCRQVKQKAMEKGKMVVNSNVAEELLPTKGGFFFGGTNYDQYYMQDIEETIQIIEELIKSGEIDGGDFYYSSSW